MTIRIAIRTLRRTPAYTVTVVGTIALSIALAAVVFAVVDGVLFKPLPYESAAQLFDVVGSANRHGGIEATATLSPADVRDLSAADPRIGVTAFGTAAGLTHPGRPNLTIGSATIDERFFDVLGQRPLAGAFTAEHYAAAPGPDAPRPAIVSYGFWRQWLGSETAAVGRTVDLVGARLTIVGVLPPDFVFPRAFGRVNPDVLFPLVVAPSARDDRWSRSLNAVARLGGGMTTEEGAARLSAVLAAHTSEYPPRRVQPGPYVAVSMTPLSEHLGARERPLFRLAFAGVMLLVVLGAINVAGLLAARGHDRERELTVRAALGASRFDLATLLLTEAAIIAVTGSIIGLALAQPLLAMALTTLPSSLLLLKSPAIDWRVTVFALTTASLVVTLFALAPVVAIVRKTRLQQALAHGAGTTARVRTFGRSALLAAESAIGLCLLLTGSLATASFIVLRSADPGFDAERLAVLDLGMTDAAAPDAVRLRHEQVFDRLRSAPGVLGVATVRVPLLENMSGGSQFGMPPGAERFMANDVPVSGAFYDVAGLSLLDGRLPTTSEIDDARPFAVVSESTARRYWPKTRAVGQTLTSRAHTLTVIGVVEEARFGAQDDRSSGEIYIPAALSPSSRAIYLLKTAGDPDGVVREAARIAQKSVPGVLVRRAESFEAALLKSIPLHRFRTVLFGVSAAAGLLILAVGVSGLVATSVARRVREMAIRTALGAERRRLVTMVVGDHLRPALVGVALGLLASWWTTRLLRAWLYQVDVHEPLVWLAATVSLLAVAVVAAWIPARRASAVETMSAIRTE